MVDNFIFLTLIPFIPCLQKAIHVIFWVITSLPNDNFLDWSKLKAFAENKFG